MTALGWIHPWGLFGVLGVVAVVVVYLFSERHRRRRVTALFLWDAGQSASRAGRRRHRIERSRSLLLDLAAAMAMAVALAAPECSDRADTTLAVVLDGSLSMQARDNHRKAVAAVEDLLEQRSGHVHLVIIEAGVSPRLRFQGRAADPRVTGVLAAYLPGAPRDSLRESVDLARALEPGLLEVHAFTDHAVSWPGTLDFGLVVHQLAARGPNPAIVSAWRGGKRFSRGDRVALGVRSNSEQAVRLKLDAREVAVPGNTTAGRAGDQGASSATRTLIEASELVLKPGETKQVTFGLPEDTGPVRIRLQGTPDLLEADSEVLLLPERSPRVRVSVAMATERAARAVSRALEATGAILVSGAADLCISDRPSGSSAAVDAGEGTLSREDAACVVATLQVAPSSGPLLSVAGPYVVHGLDPLARDLDLTGVYWSAGSGLNRRQTLVPLITVGDTALYAWTSPRSLALNVDLSRTNLVRHPAWPVLFANLVREVARRRPGLVRVNYRLGDALDYRAEASDIDLSLRSVPLHAGASAAASAVTTWLKRAASSNAAWLVPEHPGVYALDLGGKQKGLLSINAIAPDESDLRDLADESSVVRVSRLRGVSGRRERVSLAGWALLLGVLLAAGNWSLDRLEEVRHGR